MKTYIRFFYIFILLKNISIISINGVRRQTVDPQKQQSQQQKTPSRVPYAQPPATPKKIPQKLPLTPPAAKKTPPKQLTPPPVAPTSSSSTPTQSIPSYTPKKPTNLTPFNNISTQNTPPANEEVSPEQASAFLVSLIGAMVLADQAKEKVKGALDNYSQKTENKTQSSSSSSEQSNQASSQQQSNQASSKPQELQKLEQQKKLPAQVPQNVNQNINLQSQDNKQSQKIEPYSIQPDRDNESFLQESSIKTQNTKPSNELNLNSPGIILNFRQKSINVYIPKNYEFKTTDQLYSDIKNNILSANREPNTNNNIATDAQNLENFAENLNEKALQEELEKSIKERNKNKNQDTLITLQKTQKSYNPVITHEQKNITYFLEKNNMKDLQNINNAFEIKKFFEETMSLGFNPDKSTLILDPKENTITFYLTPKDKTKFLGKGENNKEFDQWYNSMIDNAYIAKNNINNEKEIIEKLFNACIQKKEQIIKEAFSLIKKDLYLDNSKINITVNVNGEIASKNAQEIQPDIKDISAAFKDIKVTKDPTVINQIKKAIEQKQIKIEQKQIKNDLEKEKETFKSQKDDIKASDLLQTPSQTTTPQIKEHTNQDPLNKQKNNINKQLNEEFNKIKNPEVMQHIENFRNKQQANQFFHQQKHVSLPENIFLKLKPQEEEEDDDVVNSDSQTQKSPIQYISDSDKEKIQSNVNQETHEKEYEIVTRDERSIYDDTKAKTVNLSQNELHTNIPGIILDHDAKMIMVYIPPKYKKPQDINDFYQAIMNNILIKSYNNAINYEPLLSNLNEKEIQEKIMNNIKEKKNASLITISMQQKPYKYKTNKTNTQELLAETGTQLTNIKNVPELKEKYQEIINLNVNSNESALIINPDDQTVTLYISPNDKNKNKEEINKSALNNIYVTHYDKRIGDDATIKILLEKYIYDSNNTVEQAINYIMTKDNNIITFKNFKNKPSASYSNNILEVFKKTNLTPADQSINKLKEEIIQEKEKDEQQEAKNQEQRKNDLAENIEKLKREEESKKQEQLKQLKQLEEKEINEKRNKFQLSAQDILQERSNKLETQEELNITHDPEIIIHAETGNIQITFPPNFDKQKWIENNFNKEVNNKIEELTTQNNKNTNFTQKELNNKYLENIKTNAQTIQVYLQKNIAKLDFLRNPITNEPQYTYVKINNANKTKFTPNENTININHVSYKELQTKINVPDHQNTYEPGLQNTTKKSQFEIYNNLYQPKIPENKNKITTPPAEKLNKNFLAADALILSGGPAKKAEIISPQQKFNSIVSKNYHKVKGNVLNTQDILITTSNSGIQDLVNAYNENNQEKGSLNPLIILNTEEDKIQLLLPQNISLEKIQQFITSKASYFMMPNNQFDDLTIQEDKKLFERFFKNFQEMQPQFKNISKQIKLDKNSQQGPNENNKTLVTIEFPNHNDHNNEIKITSQKISPENQILSENVSKVIENKGISASSSKTSENTNQEELIKQAQEPNIIKESQIFIHTEIGEIQITIPPDVKKKEWLENNFIKELNSKTEELITKNNQNNMTTTALKTEIQNEPLKNIQKNAPEIKNYISENITKSDSPENKPSESTYININIKGAGEKNFQANKETIVINRLSYDQLIKEIKNRKDQEQRTRKQTHDLYQRFKQVSATKNYQKLNANQQNTTNPKTLETGQYFEGDKSLRMKLAQKITQQKPNLNTKPPEMKPPKNIITLAENAFQDIQKNDAGTQLRKQIAQNKLNKERTEKNTDIYLKNTYGVKNKKTNNFE